MELPRQNLPKETLRYLYRLVLLYFLGVLTIGITYPATTPAPSPALALSFGITVHLASPSWRLVLHSGSPKWLPPPSLEHSSSLVTLWASQFPVAGPSPYRLACDVVLDARRGCFHSTSPYIRLCHCCLFCFLFCVLFSVYPPLPPPPTRLFFSF